MASPVKIQNFRYGVHLKFLRAFYTRPGINRVKVNSHLTFQSHRNCSGSKFYFNNHGTLDKHSN